MGKARRQTTRCKASPGTKRSNGAMRGARGRVYAVLHDGFGKPNGHRSAGPSATGARTVTGCRRRRSGRRRRAGETRRIVSRGVMPTGFSTRGQTTRASLTSATTRARRRASTQSITRPVPQAQAPWAVSRRTGMSSTTWLGTCQSGAGTCTTKQPTTRTTFSSPETTRVARRRRT